MKGTQPKEIMHSEHNMFSVGYQTANGIQLQASPFNAYFELIAHPSNYSYTQEIGTLMQDNGVVEAFKYPSARS